MTKEVIMQFETDGNEEWNAKKKEELIRCEYCCHLHDHDCPVDWPKQPNDFCSWAERREDG